MIDTPEIVQTFAQLTAVIRFTIPREELATVMEPAIAEVMHAVAAQELGPAGPVFLHHLRISQLQLDFEVGVPVSAPFAPMGRVVPSQFAAATVARTTYYGAYDRLGDAWAWFSKWIASERYTPADDLWESYVVGPTESRNSLYWRTELNRPLTNPS